MAYGGGGLGLGGGGGGPNTEVGVGGVGGNGEWGLREKKGLDDCSFDSMSLASPIASAKVVGFITANSVCSSSFNPDKK